MKNFFHRDILFSTIFVFLVMFLLRFVLINMQFLDPIYNALKDFEINDIVFSKLNAKKQARIISMNHFR